jgi:tRNA-uridine 2-sulfurtransferase
MSLDKSVFSRKMIGKKVIVAMSGGVDSSVVAAMLKKKGYDVTGIFMNFWKDVSFGDDYENKCCSLESIQSARNIAQIIGIPFYVVNVQNEFKKKVVDYFLKELEIGNTPNPCVICNKEIKFKVLLEKMLEMKADFVATGHYALIMKHGAKNMKQKFGLLEARDKNKDQSYFLYRLGQKELSKILFPLGKYTKPEIRKIAKEMSLPVHDKKESQDVCFIPEKGYENFLRKMLRLKKGKICDSKSNILGIHDGLPLYTIGQRKGIKLGGRGPFYVIKKYFKENKLIVGSEKELFFKVLKLKNICWTKNEPKYPCKILLRTRYRNPLVSAIINKEGNAILDKAQRAVTPGQSAVFYSKKGEVLGGGIIK